MTMNSCRWYGRVPRHLHPAADLLGRHQRGQLAQERRLVVVEREPAQQGAPRQVEQHRRELLAPLGAHLVLQVLAEEQDRLVNVLGGHVLALRQGGGVDLGRVRGDVRQHQRPLVAVAQAGHDAGGGPAEALPHLVGQVEAGGPGDREDQRGVEVGPVGDPVVGQPPGGALVGAHLGRAGAGVEALDLVAGQRPRGPVLDRQHRVGDDRVLDLEGLGGEAAEQVEPGRDAAHAHQPHDRVQVGPPSTPRSMKRSRSPTSSLASRTVPSSSGYGPWANRPTRASPFWMNVYSRTTAIMRRTAVRSPPSPTGTAPRRRRGRRPRRAGHAVAELAAHEPVAVEVGRREVAPEGHQVGGVVVALLRQGLVGRGARQQPALLAAVQVAEHQQTDPDRVGAVAERPRAPAEYVRRHRGRRPAQQVGRVLEVAVAADHQPRRHAEERGHQVGRVPGREEESRVPAP